MNDRQVQVVNALKRVYGEENIVTLDADHDVIHVMAMDEGVTVLSVEIPDRQDPDRPDVGDRVQFEYDRERRYGLIVVYRDKNDTIGIVPDGKSEIAWDYINNVEIVANGS